MTVTTELFSYTYQRPDDAIMSVDWSPDGKWIACGMMNGALVVLDAASGEEKVVYQLGKTRAMDLSWFPDGQNLLTNFDNNIIICEVWSGEERVLYHHGIFEEGGTSFGICQRSSDGLLIASSAYEADGPTVQVHEIETGQCIATLFPHTLLYASQEAGIHPAHRKYSPPFYPMSWSAQGTYIALGQDDTVHIWKPLTDQRVFAHSIARRGPFDEQILAFAWSPDENCLVVVKEGRPDVFANLEYMIEVWDWVAKERWSTYRGHTNVIRYMQWLTGKDQIISVSGNEIHLWDARTGTCMAQSVLPIVDEEHCTIAGAVLSPDRSQLALVGSRYLLDDGLEGLLWVWRHGLDLS